MSKRAEEAALKAYPSDTYVGGESCRRAYKEGYEQAEKDTIERAIAWLEKHADDYIVDLTPTYPDAPQQLTIGGKCWEHLKKAIEEEL